MNVLLIRHGVADDREDFAKTGASDEERPLTSKGREKLREAAPGLKQLVPSIDVLATSALKRALETADIIAEGYPDAARETIDAMAPDAPFDAFVEWLRRHRDASVVAAVGHNPHISELASWLIGDEQSVDMKKGSALLLELSGERGTGSATLLWIRTSKELKALA